MGSMSSSSSTSSTTSIMIASAPPSVLAGGAQLVAVGARGLEAVVTVGEHDRRAADLRRGSRDAFGVVDRAELVDDTVGIGAGREHRVGLELLGEAGREAQAPDRVDVRRASPAAVRAGRTSPWRRCARAGARSCRPAPAARARRSRRGCGAARRAGRGTPSGTSRSAGRVGHEHARLLPAGERSAAASS